MPMHFLIELLNFSIASDIGERVVTELSQEVRSKRVKLILRLAYSFCFSFSETFLFILLLMKTDNRLIEG